LGIYRVILLDTHVWVWWVHGDAKLLPAAHELIRANEHHGVGVSAISCWEIAKLVQVGRLVLPCSVSEWFRLAVTYPGFELLAITPQIAVESTQLPGEFHKDPADQLIVATARVYSVPLVTADTRIRGYPHVRVLPESAT
jgi:PIN domain nuclease of toxin-antitoxin system